MLLVILIVAAILPFTFVNSIFAIEDGIEVSRFCFICSIISIFCVGVVVSNNKPSKTIEVLTASFLLDFSIIGFPTIMATSFNDVALGSSALILNSVLMSVKMLLAILFLIYSLVVVNVSKSLIIFSNFSILLFETVSLILILIEPDSKNTSTLSKSIPNSVEILLIIAFL